MASVRFKLTFTNQYAGTLSADFVAWLECQVYDGLWELDSDLLDFLLGDGQ